MGKVKLTLTVEETIVNQAKEIARNSHQSLSKLIEDYLGSFKKTETKGSDISFAKKLHGIGRSEFSNMTDDQIKDFMYKDKYGL